MPMPHFLVGALAGLGATIPMTLTMESLHRFLPPHERYPLPHREMTDTLIDKAGLNEQVAEQERVGLSLLSHFSYGAATGAVYSALVHKYPIPPLPGGVTYGLGVWLISYLGWVPAAGLLTPATQHPPRRTALMITAHLVWGAALGLLVAHGERATHAAAARPQRGAVRLGRGAVGSAREQQNPAPPASSRRTD